MGSLLAEFLLQHVFVGMQQGNLLFQHLHFHQKPRRACIHLLRVSIHLTITSIAIAVGTVVRAQRIPPKTSVLESVHLMHSFGSSRHWIAMRRWDCCLSQGFRKHLEDSLTTSITVCT